MVMQTDAQRIAKESPDEFQFLMSVRGRYIIAQALHYGIQALESVMPDVMQEKSNIADMKYLRDSFFSSPPGLFEFDGYPGLQVPERDLADIVRENEENA